MYAVLLLHRRHERKRKQLRWRVTNLFLGMDTDDSGTLDVAELDEVPGVHLDRLIRSAERNVARVVGLEHTNGV